MIRQSKLHCYIYFVNLFFYDLSRVFMRGVDLCHAFFNCVRTSGKGAENEEMLDADKIYDNLSYYSEIVDTTE